MAKINSPLVRDFALGLLAERPLPWHAIWAIETSFRPGDEPFILEAIQSIPKEDESELHHQIKCLSDLLKQQDEIDWELFYRWIYEHSPCSTCRARIVRWAVEDNKLFEDWIEELRNDVDPDIRALVRERCPGG